MSKYHHGDLRGVLIAVATELLAEEGVHTLSLRKIAQKAGVSHNAPYMHFADKEAVLAAIAEEGFRLLSETVREAMFYPYDLEKYPSLLEASQASLNHLFELVEVGQANGELTSDNPHTITKVIWAMVHGVTTLSTAYKTNILSPDSPLTEETISTFMDCLLDGLAI
jgi:AcrR family transcriptional regulator